MGGYNSVLHAGDTKDTLKFNMRNKSAQTPKKSIWIYQKKWIWTAELNEAVQNNNNMLPELEEYVLPAQTRCVSSVHSLSSCNEFDFSGCSVGLYNSHLALINPNKFTVRVRWLPSK